MKVVLFCGGLGTRLREHSDTIPKPLVNVGYAADPLAPDALLRALRPQGLRALPRLPRRPDPRVLPALQGVHVERLHAVRRRPARSSCTAATSRTGASRSSTPGCTRTSASACCACASTSRDEDMFLANYSDGLSRPAARPHVRRFKRKNVVASFAAVRPSQSFHVVQRRRRRPRRRRIGPMHGRRAPHQRRLLRRCGARSSTTSSEGEELVEQPFQRLIEKKPARRYRHDGFWQAMDTFKDKITLRSHGGARRLSLDGLEDVRRYLHRGHQWRVRSSIDLEPGRDERGFFARTWCEHEFAEHGLVDAHRAGQYRRAARRRGRFAACTTRSRRTPRSSSSAARAAPSTTSSSTCGPTRPTFRRWMAWS